MKAGTPLEILRESRGSLGIDLFESLIPESDYEVAYLQQKRVAWYGRLVWTVAFKVISGGHAGAVLGLWLNLPPKGQKARRSHAIWRAWAASTQSKPPPDVARYRPSYFLEGCAFMAHVRTVKKDIKRVELPAAAHYSRIDYLISRTAGTPPCQRKR